MEFEFHGISAPDHKTTVDKSNVCFLPPERPSSRSQKKQRKRNKREKKLRRTIKKLAITVDAMQSEINDLKNFDRDGFLVLRRRRAK